MLYPALDIDGGVFVVGVADYNGGNACVDYHSLAHGAWLNIAVKLTCFCVVTGKVMVASMVSLLAAEMMAFASA